MADIEIDHNGDASPDFITDVVLYGAVKNVKYWKGGQLMNDRSILCPHVVVVKNQVEMRTYGREPNLYAVAQLVVMDGSNTIIRAVTDTCLSKFVSGDSARTLVPGSTLILKDFQVLSMNSAGATFSKIIVINDMSWRVPPKYNLAPVRSGLTPSPPSSPRPSSKKARADECMQVKTFRLAGRALQKVEREMLVVFTNPALDQPGIHTWNQTTNAEATETDFLNGNWVQDPVSRHDWMKELNPKKFKPTNSWDSDEEYFDGNFPCTCQCAKTFGFTDCVLEAFPVFHLDFEYLLHVGKRRCMSDGHSRSFLEATSWDDLPSISKHWCCYFWYTTNIFHLCGQSTESTELPDCIVGEIRRWFPSEASKQAKVGGVISNNITK